MQGCSNELDLKKYTTVIFLCTTGDILNDAQQEAFERYIQAGGGYVGAHIPPRILNMIGYGMVNGRCSLFWIIPPHPVMYKRKILCHHEKSLGYHRNAG